MRLNSTPQTAILTSTKLLPPVKISGQRKVQCHLLQLE